MRLRARIFGWDHAGLADDLSAAVDTAAHRSRKRVTARERAEIREAGGECVREGRGEERASQAEQAERRDFHPRKLMNAHEEPFLNYEQQKLKQTGAAPGGKDFVGVARHRSIPQYACETSSWCLYGYSRAQAAARRAP